MHGGPFAFGQFPELAVRFAERAAQPFAVVEAPVFGARYVDS
jgi:hypothetical protein